jgi:hypothetical protein
MKLSAAVSLPVVVITLLTLRLRRSVHLGTRAGTWHPGHRAGWSSGASWVRWVSLGSAQSGRTRRIAFELSQTDFFLVEDDELKKLLMSWYWAGYYTANYQAKQQAQQQGQ